MKKFLTYILILTILTGVFGIIFSARAADPQGTCRVELVSGNGFENITTTEVDCTQRGGSWTAGTAAIGAGGGYKFLAPLPCDPKTAGPGCTAKGLETFDPTQANNLGTYLNVMIKIFIGLCAVLAVIMIIMGGIEYITSELPGNKEHGRERILGAIFGLLLALGAYALLFTINPDILNTDLSSLKTATVEVDLNADVPQTAVGNKFGNYAVGADWTTAGTLADLTTSGATVYNQQCTTVGQSGCTSTRGLSTSILNTIHQNCPSCALSIQGGTEFWLHGGKTGSTSHQVGSSTVDLGINSALTNYIMGAGAETPTYFTRHVRDGISYLYEGNHWHAGP